ncbi:MAG: Rid family hydrolase [Planctomycetota bacterium]|jgi:enamine deaminase RidA (YjgF/YER057c/UK114 family)
MTAKLDIHRVESSAAAEIYITATPKADESIQQQAEEIFSDIREKLSSEKAHILQEKVFGEKSVMEQVLNVRSEVCGDIDDGIAPSALFGHEGICAPIAGVQVHAVRCDTKPEVLTLDGISCGRILRVPGCTYLTLSDIRADETTRKTGDPSEQAKVMMEKSESILKQFGVDFLSVPRTWMWLSDILSWYDDFNLVRNSFFTERGLIGQGSRQSMPASTGIGLYPVDGSKCAMDLTAVLEPKDSIQFLGAVGKQQCALEYGSAFSRASRSITPAGETVFVSGTASIDASGATTNIDDALGQINATIENVRAVLRDMNAADEDVVNVVAYCKTTEVEKVFDSVKGKYNWPWVTVICDICRTDLLFEIEATAMPRKSVSA